MTPGPRPGVAAPSGLRGLSTALTTCAVASGLGAAGVLLFGVVLTSGVYGSRMAWFLGVVLPLLGVTALFAGLASRAPTPSPSQRNLRRLSVVALGLLGVPLALALLLLTVYAVIFIRFGVAHLLR